MATPCTMCGGPVSFNSIGIPYCRACLNAHAKAISNSISPKISSATKPAGLSPQFGVAELFDRRVVRIRLGDVFLDIGWDFIEFISSSQPGRQEFLATVVIENGIMSITLDNSDSPRVNEIVQKFLEANKKAESEKP